MHNEDSRRVLVRVAEAVGGVAELARRLGVSERVFRSYVEGKGVVPESLVLRVIDVLLADRDQKGGT